MWPSYYVVYYYEDSYIYTYIIIMLHYSRTTEPRQTRAGKSQTIRAVSKWPAIIWDKTVELTPFYLDTHYSHSTIHIGRESSNKHGKEPDSYPLNDVDSQKTVPDDVDAVVGLARAEEDGSRWHELGLHVFTQLHEERLLKVAKGSGRGRERELPLIGTGRGRERELPLIGTSSSLQTLTYNALIYCTHTICMYVYCVCYIEFGIIPVSHLTLFSK